MSRQDLALEQQVLKAIKRLPRAPKRVLLAVSGGVDSIVMAEILLKWRRALKMDLAVAHVHHGASAQANVREYRRGARAFVKEWAQERGLEFYSNAPIRGGRKLLSEADLREWREAKLQEWRQSGGFDAIAFAHHRDDLLETRLIRLIRGTGPQGLRSMCLLRREKFRPLLEVSREEILRYARSRKLKWLEDPSNRDADVLRNWLRANWLPALEVQRPGAMGSLARSLETLVPPRGSSFEFGAYVGLRRKSIRDLSRAAQRELLVSYLRGLGATAYGQSHVEEILKRLDTDRREFSFKMLGLRFSVSSDLLWASRV